MSKILVNPAQKGNPALKHLQRVPWEWKTPVENEKMLVDYQPGETIGVLFLSVQYHRINPEYIYERIKKVPPQMYKVRILLLLLDLKENERAICSSLRELTRLCCQQNFTLLCAHGWEEVARILELLKMNEWKSPDRIKQIPQQKQRAKGSEGESWGYLDSIEAMLTKIKGVNKTDVVTLITFFQSLESIMLAPIERLMECPGIAKTKAQRIYNAFREPIKIAPIESSVTTEKDDDDTLECIADSDDEEFGFEDTA